MFYGGGKLILTMLFSFLISYYCSDDAHLKPTE